MIENLELKDLYLGFRQPKLIKFLANEIKKEAKSLPKTINIMEVCGGHTHAIMKYGLNQLVGEKVNFIHGPGCPVCVMPKERINQAMDLSLQKDVILLTLGDMIKVPGSKGSLQDMRAKGRDVRFVYSPLECIKIAEQNLDKKIIYFAIGFETTTPMTAALVEATIKQNIKNIFFHINHVSVPEPMAALLDEGAKIDGFLAPSHVSVIMGSKIYEIFPKKYKVPLVVGGFEPVDILEAILMLVKQNIAKKPKLEIQYSRSVSYEGNVKAQELIFKYFDKKPEVKFRGLGFIKDAGFKLKDEYSYLDCEKIYKDVLDFSEIKDSKACICAKILKGEAKPNECKVFGNACTPTSPIGSCMVSSEGACNAYFKYGNFKVENE